MTFKKWQHTIAQEDHTKYKTKKEVKHPVAMERARTVQDQCE